MKLGIEIGKDNLRDSIEIGNHKYTSDLSKAYFTYTLLHSFPLINSNGITFGYPLLKRYIASAQNNPINVDHKMAGNPSYVYEGEDVIVGNMVHIYMDGDSEISSTELFPSKPVAVKVVGCLWKRVPRATEILEDIANGISWKNSMEVLRDENQDVLFAGSEVFYQEDSKYEIMLDKYQSGQYHLGNQIGKGAGGTGLRDDDFANFWGSALTMQPADKEASIDSVVAKERPEFMALVASSEHNMNTKIIKKSTGGNMDKLFITTDGTFENTTIKVGDKEIGSFDDFYMGLGKYGETEFFYADCAKDESADDSGVKKSTYYRYEPEAGEFKEIDAETASRTPMTNVNVAKMLKTINSGMVSKEDHDNKIKEVEGKYEGFLSKADHEKILASELSKISKPEIDEGFKKQTIEDVNARFKELVSSGIGYNDSRLEKVMAFEFTEDGSKKVDAYIASVKTKRTDIGKILEQNNVRAETASKFISEICLDDAVPATAITGVIGTLINSAKESHIPLVSSLVEGLEEEEKINPTKGF